MAYMPALSILHVSLKSECTISLINTVHAQGDYTACGFRH